MRFKLSIKNNGDLQDLIIVPLFLTLNTFSKLIYCFYCSLQTFVFSLKFRSWNKRCDSVKLWWDNIVQKQPLRAFLESFLNLKKYGVKQLLSLEKFLWNTSSTPSCNIPFSSYIFFKDFKTPIWSNFVNGCFQQFPFSEKHISTKLNLLSFNIFIFVFKKANYLSVFSTVTHYYALAQCLYKEQAHPWTLFNSLQLKHTFRKFFPLICFNEKLYLNIYFKEYICICSWFVKLK